MKACFDPQPDTRFVRTVCPAHCGIDACGILAHVRGDRVIKVEPADFPDSRHRRICLRGLVSPEITYHPDRLRYPMRRTGERGEGKFQRISWDEALGTIAEKFREIAAEHGWPAIGWVLGGPGGGTTKFGAYLRLASLTGSTRVSAWGYGDAGLPCGSRVIFGAHMPFPLLMDAFLTNPSASDLVVVWGSNPAESAPLNIMRPIMDAKENGARLVVIDPRFTRTAAKADLYLGIRPGTDTALALGMLQVIFDRNLYDASFILQHTVGPYLVDSATGAFLRGRDIGHEDPQEYVVWDSVSHAPKARSGPGLKPALTGVYQVGGRSCKPSLQLLMELAQAYPPSRAAEITGIAPELIEKLAVKIGTVGTTTFITHMGLSRTFHGDISMRALGTVAAVTGNVNATFGGRYRRPVLNWKPFLKANPKGPSYARLGILQLYDAVTRGTPYAVKALWFSFINFLNQCVDSNQIVRDIFPGWTSLHRQSFL